MVIGNSLSSPHRHHHHHYPQPFYSHQPNKDLNPQLLRTTLHPSITVTPTITLSWPLPPPLCATMSPPPTLFDGHHPRHNHCGATTTFQWPSLQFFTTITHHRYHHHPLPSLATSPPISHIMTHHHYHKKINVKFSI